jgi:hypothetical protein
MVTALSVACVFPTLELSMSAPFAIHRSRPAHRLVHLACLATLALAATQAQAAFELAAIGSLQGTTDLSGLTGTLESGLAANVLGGIGSGLAWAGGSTYLALPDRGPNATAYTGGAAVDNTTSYIARFDTLNLGVSTTPSAVPAGSLPYTVTPTLQSTTLLWSSTPLSYGSTAGLPSAVPGINGNGRYYFTGRSDGFTSGTSTSPSNARLDPEAIRVSRDGKSVFISDEYGPYVYQFDRSTGERLRAFGLPTAYGAGNQNAVGATEISGNTAGRVANKGMEGLAISPDGTKLYGIMQSALIQDGGDTNAGKTNRIVEIDIATGKTREFAVSNQINGKGYNNSELVAINDHTLAFLPRDGKGQGDGTSAVVKQIWSIDLTNATDANDITGLVADPATGLFAGKQLLDKFKMIDLVAMLKAAGFADTAIPAKLEGMAFGEDFNGYHTLYVANDNDFIPGTAGGNRQFMIRFTDADLAAVNANIGSLQNQAIQAVPEPETWSLGAVALGLMGTMGWQRRRRQV